MKISRVSRSTWPDRPHDQCQQHSISDGTGWSSQSPEPLIDQRWTYDLDTSHRVIRFRSAALSRAQRCDHADSQIVSW
jgi:hypothetical protein